MHEAISRPFGAVYIPSETWNAYQAWSRYSPQRARRELGYARQLGLDAVRMMLSYEWWLDEPAKLEQQFEDFLVASAEHGVSVMPVLFEGNGPDPTPAHLRDTDPRTAVCLMSPSRATILSPDQWAGPLEFVRWFMNRHGGDDRLLAVEIMNEPGQAEGMRVEASRFARKMLKEADQLRRSVPLTIGSATFSDNLHYLDIGLDILQFHLNFPRILSEMDRALAEARELQAILGKPVWLTEWQRIIPSQAWDPVTTLSAGCDRPHLAGLTSLIRDGGVGAFFWSLMFRPAYLNIMRSKGLWNGIFQSDGSVWSREDAQAIAGDRTMQLSECRELPTWATLR